MSRDYDAFGDVIDNQSGIFGSEQAGLEPGLQKHQAVQHTIARHGAIFEMACQGCNAPTQMLVEWPELVAMKYGVNPVMAFRNYPGMVQEPTSWQFVPTENMWKPDVRCGRCNFHIPLRISPEEPEAFIARGRRQGLINQQGEAQVNQIASAAANAGLAAMRR